MGRKLTSHGSILYSKGQLSCTEGRFHTKELGNGAEKLVGREIHLLGTEDDGVKNESFEYKGKTTHHHNGHNGTDQVPAEFFEVVQKGHFIRVLDILGLGH